MSRIMYLSYTGSYRDWELCNLYIIGGFCDVTKMMTTIENMWMTKLDQKIWHVLLSGKYKNIIRLLNDTGFLSTSCFRMLD